MAKGVKKIQYAGGRIYQSKSVLDKSLLVPADEFISFKVKDWEPETKEEDKKKNLTWIWQTNDKPKVIIGQMPVSTSKLFRFSIPKKLCGPYSYYIEASLSGKRATKDTGIYVTGFSTPLITKSKWCTSNDGTDVRKTKKFSYGEIIYLNLDTEGLNGFRSLIVEVYNRISIKEDKKIFTYSSVIVTDGEVNLELTNTAIWQGLIDNIKEEEEFYIKVKDGTGKYIPDGNGDVAHARYLRIKNHLISNQPKVPTNLTPLKVGENPANKKRDELCRFSAITITETQKKDGKVEQTKTQVFKDGTAKSLIKRGSEIISQTVFFEFDKTVFIESSKKVMENLLNYLINDQSSQITLEGYACVIGKQEYNKELSISRTAAVKKYLVDGGIDTKRLICNARGEIQLNDGKIVGGANDDKNDKDNISHKDEKNYIEARRVDISFLIYSNNADTITYETIAPSKFKDIIIDVLDFKTDSCFRPNKDKHAKKIKATSVEYSEKDGIEKKENHMAVPIRSSLSTWNVAPLQYIWPSTSIPAKYSVDIHSCSYFANSRYNTLLIKAFPDIKWELALEFFVNVSNYKAANMPAGNIFAKHQEKSREAGYKRWLMNKQGKVPITIGVGLSAEWDEGREKRSFTQEFEKKIENIAKVIAKSTDILQNAINYAQSAARQTEIPVGFDIRYPKFTVVGKWYLERIETRSTVNTIGEVGFGFNPLIGAEIVIDIIGAAIAAASYGTTGNPAAAKLINKFRGGLDKLGASVTFTATFYGELNIMVDALKIDSVNGIKMQGKSTIGGKMGVKMELSISLEVGKQKGRKFSPIDISFKAAAYADAYFGGDFIIDSNSNGLFVEPILKFSGVMLTVEIEGELGWWKSNFKIEEKVIPEDSLSLGKKYIT